MSVPTWPASLPQRVDQNGYREGAADNVIRTDMAYGPQKRRRRGTAAPKPITIEVILDPDQWGTFLSFYEDTLNDGALSFEWVHPRTQETAMFGFTAGYEARAVGRYQIVSLPLEIMP